MTADSDDRYHPLEVEAQTTPQLVALSRDLSLFPQGSAWQELYPEVLDGRQRFDTTFQQPVASFWRFNSRPLRELHQANIDTVGQLLALPAGSLHSGDVFVDADEIRKRTEQHLKALAVTPHAHLLEDLSKVMFLQHQYHQIEKRNFLKLSTSK